MKYIRLALSWLLWFPTTAQAPIMTSLKSVNWNDPTVWSCGQIPQSGDAMQLLHTVTIPTGVTATAYTLSYEASGRILFAGSPSALSLQQPTRLLRPSFPPATII